MAEHGLALHPPLVETGGPGLHALGVTVQRLDPDRFGPGAGACGTYGGAQQHHRRGEPVCEPCQVAKARYVRWWRFKVGRHREPARCRDCGSVFPEHLCAMAEGGRRGA